MTKLYQTQLLERIAQVSEDLRELRRVQMEIATSGTASATLAAGGGSKSYTRLDLATIQKLICTKEAELGRLRARLTGAEPLIRRIQFVR